MARNKASAAASNARNRQMLKETSALRRAAQLAHITHYQPPASSIAERDAAYSAPRTITAEHCGDPLPGRSALDRRSC